MAAPRKRTARKTTTARSRASTTSGRSSTSFIAMGMIAGLAVAILFYAIFIRQDANLSKGSTPNYAHTPNQPHILNPLPPKPRETGANVATDSKPSSPAPVSEPSATTPRLSTTSPTPSPEAAPTPELATKRTPEPVIAPSKPAPERPAVTTAPAPKAPSKAPAETKAPQPRLTEDPIGNLIAQHERPSKSASPSAPKAAPSKPKEDADHLGALLKTMPAESNTSTRTVTAAAATKPAASTPESKLSLNPVPTEQRPFYLQTAAYASENEADAVRAELLLLGHSSASVHKALVNNKTVYRVRIGPYTTSSALNQSQKALQATKLKFHPVQ
ncbi:hypothetical protein CEQ07_11625 [Oligella urethralis]|uniref:SPOR domain-containing protein n=1 Tax=Oligella urethralis TaxID=90245 RepID=UPI000D00C387|nr:SPOR domain-containing protein [Oligella urethralis]AVL72010.1 hypothetical protein CEQ07_11625 [Oligella urethralis]